MRMVNIEAARWYNKAAEKGQANAQYGLGECYFYGRGVCNGGKNFYNGCLHFYQ